MAGKTRTRLTAPALVLAACAALEGCGSMSGLETKARIMSEPPCTDFFFPIYFPEYSSALSKPALGVIADAGRHAQGCMIAKVEVTGLADFKGPAEGNLKLSQDRARNVAKALDQAGLPAPEYHLNSLGDTGSVRPDGTPVPLRRRADVYIRFQHDR